MATLAARFLRRLAPLRETRCAACSTPVPPALEPPGAALSGPVPPSFAPPLCAACAAELARRKGGFCPHCGELADLPTLTPGPCGECLLSPRPWNAFFFHGAYSGLLRDLILRCKAGRELPLAALLGSLFAAHPGLAGPYDAIVPMPLHTRRLRQRGFNQASEMAKPLAARLGVPIENSLLAREKDTRSQAGLAVRERKRNVRNVFIATGDAAGKRILLLDDVATTCATLESAANALLRAGALSVDAAAAARTPKHGHG